jgi:transglutaminase-like putative cysteine protease
MRLYQVRHSTSYTYYSDVQRSRNLCLQLPRALFYQHIRQEHLHIDPTPESVRTLHDGLGNRLLDFTVCTPHRYFEVRLELEIEIHARHWELGCDYLSQALHRLDDLKNPNHLEAMAYKYPSRHVQWDNSIQELSTPLLQSGAGPHTCAQQLMERIFQEWTFCAHTTHIHTSVNDLLINRRGVCQDFSHLMIAALRSIGIPARYVSGYLETLPKPGQPKLIGADVSHAWVQVYDPIAGWKDFDPTNNLIPSEQHITLAFGRDFADISPLRGLVSGGGPQELKVSVDVQAL